MYVWITAAGKSLNSCFYCVWPTFENGAHHVHHTIDTINGLGWETLQITYVSPIENSHVMVPRALRGRVTAEQERRWREGTF